MRSEQRPLFAAIREMTMVQFSDILVVARIHHFPTASSGRTNSETKRLAPVEFASATNYPATRQWRLCRAICQVTGP
jgi:hypothetical protein